MTDAQCSQPSTSFYLTDKKLLIDASLQQ